ncbi:uncharacterized protein LOC128324229 isoform X1 [Hemicordylus capensis]|uniref:uncharacterized protein LOC128324229 isoform X1 n=1 Tax=Hemicordylus capensis TaxID=884348 RepID=UPI0023025415|nr:uncharacterized protein LOC128324229 isoform X1 [Hemicordylus capensis]
MLNEETSMPGSLPGPRVHTDIPEGELNEATSVPGSLPGPHITNDILGKEVNEETSVPGPSIPTGTPKEAAFVSEPSIADNYLEQEVEILKGLQNDYVQRQMRVLQAINLQIGHTRTRLIRSEVRLQWWGKEGDQALMPVIQTASHDDPAGQDYYYHYQFIIIFCLAGSWLHPTLRLHLFFPPASPSSSFPTSSRAGPQQCKRNSAEFDGFAVPSAA